MVHFVKIEKIFVTNLPKLVGFDTHFAIELRLISIQTSNKHNFIAKTKRLG